MKALHVLLKLFPIAGIFVLIGCAEENPLTADRADGSWAEVEGSSDPASKVDKLPPALEQKVERFKADMEGLGYEVMQGYWTVFSVEDCAFPIKTVGNCYGNNPAAPYVLPAVPQWKDEFVDRKLHLVFGALHRNTSATYRLDEREALVILGVLPPPGAYFGIQTYVYSRQAQINTADPVYTALAPWPDVRNLLFTPTPNPDRMLAFASIGNNVNHVVVERASGAAFDQERSFVITPDRVMEQSVTEGLLRAGVPDASHVLTEPVSSDLVRVGLGPGADDLLTVLRYAMPDDPDAAERWRERLPLAVLRVRDTRATRPTEPYPKPTYDTREATPEFGLADALTQLVVAVKETWEQPDAAVATFFNALSMVDLVGQHCLQRPMNCLGDTQDTDTYRISPPLSLDGGEVIAIVGTLATATGNASYVSLGVNRSAVLTGVANLSEVELEGTAAAFSGRIEHADKFYVHYLARDCTGITPCLEVSEKNVPKGEAIKIIQRNYLFPGSARGADATKLLNPRAIVLDGAEMSRGT